MPGKPGTAAPERDHVEYLWVAAGPDRVEVARRGVRGRGGGGHADPDVRRARDRAGDPGLVRVAETVAGATWWRDEENPAGPPRVRAGVIASGDKVIDDPSDGLFAAVQRLWPKLLAVEMEGSGVAERAQRPGQLQS